MTTEVAVDLYKLCLCKKQPHPDTGLEGYQRDQVYYYENAVIEGRKMMRVFPQGCHPLDREEDRHYQIISKYTFEKYFRVYGT